MSNEGIGDICATVEDALKAWVGVPTFCPETQVYCGLENREAQDKETKDSSYRQLPAVVCICQRAPAMPINFHGGFNPECVVQVISQRDTTDRTTHRARVREVFDKFLTSTIADDLSGAIDNFTAEGIVVVEINYDLKLRNWVSELHFILKQVVCQTVS